MTKISEDLLQGKTLKVYWFLLEHANSGVREIDRQLGFNSPSTVLYHINKLVEVGLVEKTTQDKYTAKEYVSSGILGLYLKIGPGSVLGFEPWSWNFRVSLSRKLQVREIPKEFS